MPEATESSWHLSYKLFLEKKSNAMDRATTEASSKSCNSKVEQLMKDLQGLTKYVLKKQRVSIKSLEMWLENNDVTCLRFDLNDTDAVCLTTSVCEVFAQENGRYNVLENLVETLCNWVICKMQRFEIGDVDMRLLLKCSKALGEFLLLAENTDYFTVAFSMAPFYTLLIDVFKKKFFEVGPGKLIFKQILMEFKEIIFIKDWFQRKLAVDLINFIRSTTTRLERLRDEDEDIFDSDDAGKVFEDLFAHLDLLKIALDNHMFNKETVTLLGVGELMRLQKIVPPNLQFYIQKMTMWDGNV